MCNKIFWKHSQLNVFDGNVICSRTSHQTNCKKLCSSICKKNYVVHCIMNNAFVIHVGMKEVGGIEKKKFTIWGDTIWEAWC